MAQSSPFSSGMSRQQFKDALYNWFKDRGLFQELEMFLRQKMALRLIEQTSTARTFSPKAQALDMLIADHLFLSNYNYTLSVFVSESNIPWSPNSSKTFLDFLRNQEEGSHKLETATANKPVLDWQTAQQILKSFDLNLTKEDQNNLLKGWQLGHQSLLTHLIERDREPMTEDRSRTDSKVPSERAEKQNNERLDDWAQLHYLTSQLHLLNQPETRAPSIPRTHPRVNVSTSATQTVAAADWATDGASPVALLTNQQVLTLQRNHASQSEKIGHLEKVISQLKQQLQDAHQSLALAQTQLRLSHQRMADTFLQAMIPTGPPLLPSDNETSAENDLDRDIEKELGDTEKQMSDLQRQYQSLRFAQICDTSVSASLSKMNAALGD